MDKNYPSKGEAKKKQYSNIAISWDDAEYESGDDDDFSFAKNHETTNVTMCLMAMIHTTTSIYSDADSDEENDKKNASIDYESLYMMKFSRNKDLGETIVNLRSEIRELNDEMKDLKCISVDEDSLKLKYEIVGLKKALLFGVE